MRKTSLLLLLGFLVFIAPYLGVPEVFLERMLLMVGVSIMFVALLFRLEERRRERASEDVYHEEHDPMSQDDVLVREDIPAYAEPTQD